MCVPLVPCTVGVHCLVTLLDGGAEGLERARPLTELTLTGLDRLTQFLTEWGDRRGMSARDTADTRGRCTVRSA